MYQGTECRSKVDALTQENSSWTLKLSLLFQINNLQVKLYQLGNKSENGIH